MDLIISKGHLQSASGLNPKDRNNQDVSEVRDYKRVSSERNVVWMYNGEAHSKV